VVAEAWREAAASGFADKCHIGWYSTAETHHNRLDKALKLRKYI